MPRSASKARRVFWPLGRRGDAGKDQLNAGSRTKAGDIGKLVVVKHDADHVRRGMARFARREGAPFELFRCLKTIWESEELYLELKVLRRLLDVS